MSKGSAVLGDSTIGHTINDVVRDLINEGDDDGTLALLVSEQVQASKAHNTAAGHDEKVGYHSQ